jgi:nitroimidazol reductase NimA-like FMN-containing flavoprotein (pyridoxamine 5'-phosphate oxidase superfamily)
MTREEQLEAIASVLRAESFAVFSFAGAGAGDPPYSSVMFFAETGPARLAFGTSPGTVKGPYLRTGNGACAQVDTRAAGLENMSQFARVTIQGRLRRVEEESERAQIIGTYVAKLPNAKVFVARPVWRSSCFRAELRGLRARALRALRGDRVSRGRDRGLELTQVRFAPRSNAARICAARASGTSRPICSRASRSQRSRFLQAIAFALSRDSRPRWGSRRRDCRRCWRRCSAPVA